MLKTQKGAAGYLRIQTRKIVLKCIVEFGIVIALLILGITQTKTRLNMLTVFAVLGCLPASKALVELFMIIPHKTVSTEIVEAVEQKGESLTRNYDLVFTSEKKIMPVESIVIKGYTVCGYASKKKHSPQTIEEHLKQYFNANQLQKTSVKIYDDFSLYLVRVEEMNRLKNDDEARKIELAISKVLKNLSL